MSPFIPIAIIVAVMALLVTLGIMSEKARKRKILEFFERVGGKAQFAPGPAEQTDAIRRVPMLASLPRAGEGINFIGSVSIEGQPATLVAHRYTTGAGKNRRTHYHTVAAVDCPSRWPELTVSPETIFHRLAAFFGSKDIQLDDAEFNKRWRVQGPDENFALVCLDPSVQSWINTYAQGLSIRIGQGAACVIAYRQIKPEELQSFLPLPGALVKTMPVELQAY